MPPVRRRPKAKLGSEKRGPKPQPYSRPEKGTRPARSAPRDPNTDPATRGAIIALKEAGHPAHEMQEITRVPLRTLNNINQRAKRKAAVLDVIDPGSSENEARGPLHPKCVKHTVHPTKPQGRPSKFTAEHKAWIVSCVLKDHVGRRKSASAVAREFTLAFHGLRISVPTVIKILNEEGLRQHVPCYKPRVTKKNKDERFQHALENKDKPVKGFWDGWLWTDEMHFNLDDHSNVSPVWRYDTEEEEWNPDCVDVELDTDVRQMFWGAITYNKPCSECPFYVFGAESDEDREKAHQELEEENEEALAEVEREMGKTLEEYMAEEKARRAALPKGQKPKGKIAVPPEFKVTKSRGKKLKHGIDWFRYREEICRGEGRLYESYWSLVDEHLKGERGKVVLMEDGAGPHRAKAMTAFHWENGINKAHWPPQSPDLNPIERVWAYIRNKIAHRTPFPLSKKALIAAWTEEWKAIPVSVTKKFIEDMALEKLQKCFEQGGDNKFYG